MSNTIFQAILDRKIEYFIQSFVEDADSIFYKDEKLFHPGEYGKFRENTLKELLRMLIPTNNRIGDGFIITSKNNVSTQCDIIIFENENLPLLNDGIYQFYTIESTLAIGEVKSAQSKIQLKETLRKLASNKMLQDERTYNIKKRKSNFIHNEDIFSFLICRKIENPDKLNFNEIYGDIPKRYWHNCILSIEDGFQNYILPIMEFEPELKNEYLRILGMSPFLYSDYPVHYENGKGYQCIDNFSKIENDNKQNHIIMFLKCIVNSLSMMTTFNTEFLSYSNLDFVVLDKSR